MRQGSILDGILAGFQAYKGTKDWQSQRKSTQLEQERATWANRILETQYSDYTNPMGKFNREQPVREAGFQEELGQLRQRAPVETDIAVGRDRALFEADKEQFPEKLKMALEQAKQLGLINNEVELENARALLKLGFGSRGQELDDNGGGKAKVSPSDANRTLKMITGDNKDMFSATDLFEMSSAIESGDTEWAAAHADGIKFINSADMKDALSMLKDLPDDAPYYYNDNSGTPQSVPWRPVYDNMFATGKPKAEIRAFVDDLISQRTSQTNPQTKMGRAKRGFPLSPGNITFGSNKG